MKTKTWERRKLLKYSFVTLVLFLLLLEGAARILFEVKFGGLNTSVYIQGSPLLIDDSNTVYNNRPGYVDYQKKFQYNQLGMKSTAGNFQMPVKKNNELWVLLLGGSAMEGMGSNKNGKWLDITGVTDHAHEETIAAFLQLQLEKHLPGKELKVFNAAVSGYTITQSRQRYQALSRGYDFDWIISMDGVNEPSMLLPGQSIRDFNKNEWAAHPSNFYPLNCIIAVTRHSALFNLLKQELFYLKQNTRMKANEYNSFPERSYWYSRQAPAALVAVNDAPVRAAVDSFFKELLSFERQLKKEGKNHLLLIQPHLSFRNDSVMTREEKALFNYYRSEHNDSLKYAFLRAAYDSVNSGGALHTNIQAMNAVHDWAGWTFVDYCHFTSAANRRIAAELADYIVAEGSIRIFRR